MTSSFLQQTRRKKKFGNDHLPLTGTYSIISIKVEIKLMTAYNLAEK